MHHVSQKSAEKEKGRTYKNEKAQKKQEQD